MENLKSRISGYADGFFVECEDLYKSTCLKSEAFQIHSCGDAIKDLFSNDSRQL